MQLFRPTPVLPPQSFKTYQLLAPIQRQKRKASCIEAGCAYRKTGWKTIVDTSTDLGSRQAQYIRMFSGRKYKTQRTRSGLTAFIFFPDQDCFNTHYISLEREPLYIVRGGDWRGNPERVRTVRRTEEQWVDDFSEHQEKIARAVGR